MPKTILLVEDNASDEKLTLRALERCGVACEVVVRRDGPDALDYLLGTGESDAGHRPSPALILLDLNLPRLDGLDVLRRIRLDPRTRLLPVVMLTSSKQDEDVRGSYVAGANAYACKPVDFTEFGHLVKTLAVFWLVINELPTGASE